MKKLRVFLTIILIGIWSSTGRAQTDSLDISYEMSLEELLQIEVTTATKTSHSIMDIPGAVTIITKNDIERMGFRKLSDVLMTIPGFGHIQNDDEHLYSVRGIYATTNQKFLILRDGHRINEFMFDRIIAQYELSLHNIKKIEIVRGPGASLYGNAAVTAVVNLITEDTDHVSISVGLGNYGQKGLDVLFSKNFSENESVMAYMHYSSTAGEPYQRSAEDDYADAAVAFSEEIRIDHYPDNYDFGFRYSKNALTVSAAMHRSAYRMYWGLSGQNADVERLPQDLRSETEDVHSEILFEPRLKNENWNLGFQHTLDYSQVPQLSKMVANHLQYPPYGRMLSFGWRGYTFKTNYYGIYAYEKGDIIIGTMAENRETIESYFMSNWADSSVMEYSTTPLLPAGDEFRGATYFQIQHRFHEKFLINAGARYDYAADFDGTFSPRVALIFQPVERIATKIVYTQAYQAPSYFYRNSNPNLGYGSTESLNAEIMNSWQGIFRYNFTNLSFFELVYYHNHLDNLIRKDGNEYKNLGQITIQGVEAETKAVVGKFSAFANYSWMIPVTDRIDDAYKAQNIKDDKLKHLPEHTINAGINYQFFEQLNLNIFGQWTSGFYSQSVFDTDYKVDSKFLLNSTISFRNLIQGVNLSFSAYNLLNTKYKVGDPVAPSPMPQAGLWYLFKIGYQW